MVSFYDLLQYVSIFFRSLLIIILIFIVIYVIYTKQYEWVCIIARTYKRDYRGLKFINHSQKQIARLQKNRTTLHKQFLETLQDNPHKVAVIFEKQKWSFNDIEEFSNKIANYFHLEGYAIGDCVGLFYENRPEFIGIVVGFSKIGVITSLINTNLVGDSLVHSISIAKCKGLIFGVSYLKTVAKVLFEIKNLKLYQLSDSEKSQELLPGAIDLDYQLKRSSKNEAVVREEIEPENPLCYIYTSGTTGLPKAAILTHIRYLSQSNIMQYIFDSDDILYNPLPLYHGLGIMGVALTISHGVTVVIRKKFSASHYWEDCSTHECTHAMYIGEMCRYILNVPNINVPDHKVSKILGNGLKIDVWVDFVKKFKIKDVYEFYTSTEGVIVFANLDNKVGAVGFIPLYMRRKHTTQLVKFDEEIEEPIRDEDGYCIRCKIGEPGLAIGRIQKHKVMTNFHGYLDQAQTKQKFLYNVFEPGDLFFNSGDILQLDELGYVYFKDRTGDTFRWKGENVSTYEIETIIGKFSNNSNVVVIGVEVPGTEGKAGMAILADPQKLIDMDELCLRLLDSLPKYAIPLFVRLIENIPITSTYKTQKMELKKQGYDPCQITDPLYFFVSESCQYVPLTKDIYDAIQNLEIKL